MAHRLSNVFRPVQEVEEEQHEMNQQLIWIEQVSPSEYRQLRIGRRNVSTGTAACSQTMNAFV